MYEPQQNQQIYAIKLLLVLYLQGPEAEAFRLKAEKKKRRKEAEAGQFGDEKPKKKKKIMVPEATEKGIF